MAHAKRVRILFIILAALIVAAAAIGGLLFEKYRELRENPMSAFAATGNDTQTAYAAEPQPFAGEAVQIDGKPYVKKPNMVTILMIGIDWDGSKEKDETGKRGDMAMLCTIDLAEGQEGITFTSIPRDTRTTVHYAEKGTGKISAKTCVTKLCHAYQLAWAESGNDEAGAANQMRAVQDLIGCDGQLDLPVDYYVSVDLEHLAELAGALGGVEVTLDQHVPGVGDTGDTVTLEGETVRLYLQNRKDEADGEMDRQRHQQTFMMAVAKKMKDMGAVNAAGRLFPQLANKVIQTNLSMDQIVAMAGVLDKISSLDDVKLDMFEEKDGSWKKYDDPIVKRKGGLDYYIMDPDELLQKMLGFYYAEQ